MQEKINKQLFLPRLYNEVNFFRFTPCTPLGYMLFYIQINKPTTAESEERKMLSTLDHYFSEDELEGLRDEAIEKGDVKMIKSTTKAIKLSKATELSNGASKFVLELSKEEYADLIITLGYAWENVRAEDEEYHDDRSAERVDRVKGSRDVVCNKFTVKEV